MVSSTQRLRAATQESVGCVWRDQGVPAPSHWLEYPVTCMCPQGDRPICWAPSSGREPRLLGDTGEAEVRTAHRLWCPEQREKSMRRELAVGPPRHGASGGWCWPPGGQSYDHGGHAGVPPPSLRIVLSCQDLTLGPLCPLLPTGRPADARTPAQPQGQARTRNSPLAQSSPSSRVPFPSRLLF